MPVDVKVRDGVGKWPLKELLRLRGFDDAFLHRQKTGFSFPIEEWLVRAIRNRPDYAELFRAPLPPLDAVATTAVLDRLLAGENVGHIAWCVLVLSSSAPHPEQLSGARPLGRCPPPLRRSRGASSW